jgi:outer membrane protein assembly factor BamB
VAGTLTAFTPEGETLWVRSLSEEFGLITTHGGRTQSPVIEGDLVIVSGLSSGWGEQARGGHRFFAFHKSTGETYWVSSPGGAPYDTTYAPLYATEIGGTRLLMTGGGDGAMHAIKPQTGEPVWRFEYSKRGINNGAIAKDGVVVVTQGEENLHTSEMGLVAAIDGTARGELKPENARWLVDGFLGGFSTPVLDGDRFYVIDNAANLAAFDFATGRELWRLNLGTIQRASPVLADGKLYVGTVNGSFYIVEPSAESGKILDQDELAAGDAFEEIYASVAVSDGRVYLASANALYAIGAKKSVPSERAPVPTLPAGTPGEPTHLQVVPTEVILAPGESIDLKARLFDDKGRFVREADSSWTVEGLEGTVDDGRFTVSSAARFQAGKVIAKSGALSGSARFRVVPPLPWKEDFASMERVPGAWINATGKFVPRAASEMAGMADIGDGKILVKTADNAFLRRARVYLGPPEWSDYTIEADVRATKKGRQFGTMGVLAQRYQLTLLGNNQRVELQSWQPETKRTAQVRFPWEADKWYRMKLEVTTSDDGSVVARGKVWPRDAEEPTAWLVERKDAAPNRNGSPGIYADAQPTEVFFDNLEVRANEGKARQ